VKPSFTPNQLHVIAVINNPLRFNSRLRLFQEFAARMRRDRVNLHIVEAAFGARDYEVTEAEDFDHVQLRQTDELWLKENLVNIGVRRLPSDWQYVAWIDADVELINRDWAVETIHQLQHFAIVQLFQTAVDLGPRGESFRVYDGFGYSHAHGLPIKWTRDVYTGMNAPVGVFRHPGYAWAMRREAYDDLGGLMEHAILGAGDHHMALALLGMAHYSVPATLHPHYHDEVYRWQDRATRHIRQNLGYVPGTLLHHWHGKKVDRRYIDRWKILEKHRYDPLVDVKHDAQGLLIFSDQGIRMRNDLRDYFRCRHEDSIDFE